MATRLQDDVDAYSNVCQRTVTSLLGVAQVQQNTPLTHTQPHPSEMLGVAELQQAYNF